MVSSSMQTVQGLHKQKLLAALWHIFFPLQPECITCFPLLQLSFLVTYSLNLLAFHSSPLWASNDQIPFFFLLLPDKRSEKSQLLGHLLQTLLDSLFFPHCPRAEAPSFSTHHLLCLKSLSIPTKLTRVEKMSRKLQRACPIAQNLCSPFFPPNLLYSL